MRQLPVQPWMRDAPTTRLIAALRAEGAEVRFVGGCVRDTLAGRPVKDIDIATPATPDDVVALLVAAGLEAVPTGFAHGTVTAIVDGGSYEVTTLRRDIETDGRHARVAFTGDWEVDAARRDFTINAMSLDPDGGLHDPFGGSDDLAAGRVRFVGSAESRVREDYLRVLRFFRFQAHYGRGEPDIEAIAACRGAVPQLSRISVERVSSELLRILHAPDPACVIAIMADTGVLRATLPEGDPTAGIPALRSLVTIEGITKGADPLRRLAVLINGSESRSRSAGQRLRLSRAQIERLSAIAPDEPAIAPDLPESNYARWLYRGGADWFADRVIVSWARNMAAHGAPDRALTDGWMALLERARRWTDPKFPLNGADLVERGLEPGPEIGALLRAVEEWWIDSGFLPNRIDCLGQLDELAGKGAGGS